MKCGDVFGNWTAIRKSDVPGYWLLKCGCGSERLAFASNVKSGASKSCGCWSRAMISASKLTHGKSNTRTYRIWANMLTRCTNEKCNAYSRYGGRGITVCDDWRRFEGFLSDMGEAPAEMSLDRKDNNAGYSRENCRWASRKQQGRNTRVNRLLKFEGITLPMSAWSEQLGIPQSTILNRLKRNWPIEDVLRQGKFKNVLRVVSTRQQEAA
jgi:hypothetical protein